MVHALPHARADHREACEGLRGEGEGRENRHGRESRRVDEVWHQRHPDSDPLPRWKDRAEVRWASAGEGVQGGAGRSRVEVQRIENTKAPGLQSRGFVSWLLRFLLFLLRIRC